MLSTSARASISVTAARPADVETDMLFLPCFEGEDVPSVVPGLDDATRGMLGDAARSGEFRARLADLFVTPLTGWRAPRVAAIGAGPAAEFDTERLRRMAAAAGLAARQRRVRTVAFLARGYHDERAAVQAIAEGLGLANFSGDAYKSGERSAPPLESAVVIAPGGTNRDLEAAAERGRILADSCNVARELCNEPSNVLTPGVLAERAVAIGTGVGLDVDVLDRAAISTLNMNLLLGVARGSAEPPHVIVLKHSPKGAPAAPVLGLVGKGITFDTGGISIKPADGMERMKDDMSGGAAVIGAMRAIALLEAPIRVIGIVPATENMPGGRAFKPGDVLTGASGTTVEVLNTDAEGRLILGDALWYARQLGATHLVDIATLTGACVIALGRAASGLFGRPAAWVEVVRRTAEAAGDRSWPMPLFEEYREQIKSEIADIANTGGRAAGAGTAAMFLETFAGGLPWAHLDIAGTAWADEVKPWQPKGATGVGVRTLAELAFTSGSW